MVKSNGRREAFDRDKVERSMQIALLKRSAEERMVEAALNGIVRRVEHSGETEVSSQSIGGYVMEALEDLDQVAYVRFASVCRNSRETKDFEEFIDRLHADGRDGGVKD